MWGVEYRNTKQLQVHIIGGPEAFAGIVMVGAEAERLLPARLHMIHHAVRQPEQPRPFRLCHHYMSHAVRLAAAIRADTAIAACLQHYRRPPARPARARQQLSIQSACVCSAALLGQSGRRPVDC